MAQAPSMIWLEPYQRTWWWKYLFPVAVGAAVGAYVSFAMMFKLVFTVVAVGAIVIPCLAFMLGNSERFFALVFLFLIPLQITTRLGVRVDPHPGGAVPTFELVVQELPLAVVIVIWFARALSRQRLPALRWGAIETAFLWWWAMGALTWFFTVDRSLTFWELVRMLKFFVVFLYFANNLRSRDYIAQAAGVLAIGTFLQCVVTLLSYVFKLYVTGRLQVYRLTDVFAYGTDSALWTDIGLTPPGSEEIWGFFRPGGTIGGFNITCMYICFFVPMILTGYIAFKNLALRIVFGIALAVSCAAIILTYSRGGWLNTAVGFLTVLYIGYRRGWVDRTIRLQMAGVAALAVLVAFGYGPVREKIIKRFTFVDADTAVSPRIAMMKGAVNMIVSRPVLGVGLNTYIDNTKKYHLEFEDSHELFPVHNKFLLVAAETGFLGLVGFVGFLGFSTWLGIQNLRIRDPVLDPINVGVLGGLFGSYTHMQLDIYDVYGVQNALFLSLALMTAIHRYHTGVLSEEKGFWRVTFPERPRFGQPIERFDVATETAMAAARQADGSSSSSSSSAASEPLKA